MDTEKENLLVDTEKKEDALATIKEICAEKALPKKRHPALTVLMAVFFPITGIVLFSRFLMRKVRLSITVKATLIFAVLFGALIISYVIFTVASIEGHLTKIEAEGAKEYLANLKTASGVLIVVFISLGTGIGYIACQYMMTPLRKMIKKIDKVDSGNLSVRLDPTDSQDELMELTGQINEMLDELESAFERQSNFISDASHELKTPISVIQGYANMLKRWGKSDPALLDESIETLLSEAENMKRIVEQLLLLAKIGSLTAVNTRFDLSEVVGETVAQYALSSSPKKPTFSSDGKIEVETDRNMLIESVRALIDNAIKYTGENGVIKVVCRRTKEGAEIEVSDNGIGISPENLPHIFERFYRCDKSRSRAMGSSGLGLTITKSIVELMGGNIEVKSEVGRGSVFTIKLY